MSSTGAQSDAIRFTGELMPYTDERPTARMIGGMTNGRIVRNSTVARRRGNRSSTR
jgi:hypothetical protein